MPNATLSSQIEPSTFHVDTNQLVRIHGTNFSSSTEIRVFKGSVSTGVESTNFTRTDVDSTEIQVTIPSGTFSPDTGKPLGILTVTAKNPGFDPVSRAYEMPFTFLNEP